MARPRVRHELKTWPQFFVESRAGRKRFELRRDDRPEGFQVGDELLLREWDPKKAEYKVGPYPPGKGEWVAGTGYTGREVLVRVDYIMPADQVDSLMGLVEIKHLQGDLLDYVIMSVSLVN